MEATTVTLFISFSLVVFGIAYYYLTHRHRERMFILSKGLPPDYFKGHTDYLPLLLILGITASTMAPAIILGAYLVKIDAFNLKGSLLFFSVIFFSVGVGLIVSYLVIKHLKRKK